MATRVFTANKQLPSSVMPFIECRLKACKIPKLSMAKALLASEESLVKLLEHGAEGSKVTVSAIIDMFETASNCLGDVSVTAIVARNEKLLDENIYYYKQ